MTIYLVRHGEVANNTTYWYGRLPGFSLSEKGEKQIERTGVFLSSQDIQGMYASPMLRTKQTARIIQKAVGLSLITFSKSIIEIGSSFQGQPLKFLDSIAYDFYSSRHRKDTDETMEQIAKRFEKMIRKILKIHEGKNIVLVSHGDPIMIMKAKIEGLPLTFSSIRDNYVQHGQVYRITGSSLKSLQIQSVFTP